MNRFIMFIMKNLCICNIKRNIWNQQLLLMSLSMGKSLAFSLIMNIGYRFPLGKHRSVEWNDLNQKRHPVRDASSMGCKFVRRYYFYRAIHPYRM